MILAAGSSTRYGGFKLIQNWQGKLLIRHVAEILLKSNVYEILVTIGYEQDKVKNVLKGLPLRFVKNPTYLEGQGSSVRKAVETFSDDIGGAIFLLADQPQIPYSLINTLIERHASTLAPIIAPYVNRKRATPVLFDKSTFDDLKKLHGEKGGRALFEKFPVAKLSWSDPSILIDIDIPEDLKKLNGK